MVPTTLTQARKGRPLNLTDAIAARILARKSGFCDRHARRLLAASPGELSADSWRAVAILIEHGARAADDAEHALVECGFFD